MSHIDHANPDDAARPAPVSTLGPVARLLLWPAAAVLVLVLIALTLGWFSAGPKDVYSLADLLAREGGQQWRAAVLLAGALNDPANAALKQDRALAGRLSRILESRLRDGRMEQDQITLRIYLCRSLGEFHLPDVLPALLEAAKTERDEREVDVRRSALEAIAVLASNLGAEQLPSGEETHGVVLEASRDRRAIVRSAAAFTLGVLGGQEAQARLAAMMTDGYPDVRYNAATGLARQGNALALDVLLEMLDPRQSAAMEVEKQEASRAWKHTLVLLNGLRASRQLAAANRGADLSRLREAVRRLASADVDAQLRVEAAALLRELEARGDAGESP